MKVRRATAALCAFVVVALAGCAGSGVRGFGRDTAGEAEVERHVKRGYAPDDAYATTATRETWTVDGEPIEVSLLGPVGDARHPLVVFLPGLGDTAESSLAWRKAWAEAGYAVLAVQPASEGSAVWKSEQARLGDFSAIARSHFAAASLAHRAQLLDGVFAELSRRASSASLAHVDASRIAVAGFDLGAQTAMIVAGQRVDGVSATRWPSSVKSVIALSPYADFSGMGLAADFGDIRMPVLGVTSAEDTDAYGLVTSASVRRAPFQYMPPGHKYLLVLAGAPHSLISGRESPDTASAQRDAGASGGGSSSRGSRGSGRRGMRDRGDAGPGSAGSSSSTVNWKMELADAKVVSVAFLDATVKDDSVAREWLSKDAQRWLGDLGQLSSK